MGKNKKKQWDLLVIGAGAAGMMTAITAAKTGKKVIIIEQLDKAGKKLLATGNGKCNFTNEHMHIECYGGNKKFIEHVLEQFSVNDCLEFFHSIGVYPKSKNGYYYPNSEQASSVVLAFEQELYRLGVTICLQTQVQKIKCHPRGVQLYTNEGVYDGRKAVIATGLLAAPKLGSNGSLFEEIKHLGHHFTPVLPALCGFYCKGISFKKVAGVRAHASVCAWINEEKVAEDTGEVQFTDYGLSGIPVFQISRFLSKGLYEKKKVQIHLNLLPTFDKKALLDELSYRKVRMGGDTVLHLLNGLLNQKLAVMILEQMQWKDSTYISSLTDKELKRMAEFLQNLTVSVTKYRDYEFAQVCTGGISIDQIDAQTLASKFAENIYFAGEILDVDGICGGYNLHFAWATGFLAGKS